MRHVLRILLVTLALVLLGLALAPRAVPAQAAGPCDSTRRVPLGWVLRPAAPCDADSLTLVFQSCRGCVDLTGYARPDSGPLRLDVSMPARCSYTEECVLDSLAVPLGVLSRGAYTVRYVVHASVAAGDSSAACTFTREASLSFTVCAPPPPEPGCDSLPYVTTVRIGPPAACDSCVPRICPGDSIPLHVAGWFSNGCYRFAGLELSPGPEASPVPAPPIVRIRVTRAVCSMCTMAIVPWSADTTLPALPGGDYRLRFELVRTDLCNGTPTDTTYCRTSRLFTVKDTCASVATSCVMADWMHPGTGCDDFILPGGRARVVMTAQSSVPLAGLQGSIQLGPRGLLITNLEPVGRAAGMRVAWERTPQGANFMMFAESGAPIGGLRCEAGTRCIEPVLAVSMVPDTDAVLPAVTHVSAGNLLGADSLGGAVPQCEIMTLVVVEARVCARPSCDFNLDGWLDVRDLVTMVRCVLGRADCPDTSRARLDCNQDGQVRVDDVLCCARVILRGGERDGGPGRAEPDVAVGFGEPVGEAGALSVPVRVRAADRIGAARLALSLPLDRYDVTGVEVGAANPQWLALHEAVDGQLVLGIIGLGPDLPAEEPETLELTIHLASRSGAAAGGEVGLADLQASGRDGVTLELSTAPAAVPLPLPATTGLSAARPNPFSGATRLALALERSADVDVTVHDLSGRRVATLFHGALPAGVHEFTWSGVRADGSAAAHGVYFVQARVDGERLTRKLVLLRGE
jgi:hypothetical protein